MFYYYRFGVFVFLFSGFLQFTGNFVWGVNSSKCVIDERCSQQFYSLSIVCHIALDFILAFLDIQFLTQPRPSITFLFSSESKIHTVFILR